MRTTSSSQGFALVLAIVIMAVIGALAAGLGSAVLRSYDTARAHERRLVARNLAEAGIDYAVAQLRAGNSVQNTTVTLGEGSFSLSPAPKEGDMLEVVATGEYRSDGQVLSRVTLAARIASSGDGPRVTDWREAEP